MSSAAPLTEHANGLLRWWAVIVAMITAGAWAVRKGVVAPRTELARLTNEVGDLRDDMSSNAKDHESIGHQLDALSLRLDRVHDLILRLHTAHGIPTEEE